jgi:hypothetical protein
VHSFGKRKSSMLCLFSSGIEAKACNTNLHFKVSIPMPFDSTTVVEYCVRFENCAYFPSQLYTLSCGILIFSDLVSGCPGGEWTFALYSGLLHLQNSFP